MIDAFALGMRHRTTNTAALAWSGVLAGTRYGGALIMGVA